MSATYPDLAGKVVVVSGGASGIGAATCRAFAEQGASVWIMDTDLRAANAVSAELGGSGQVLHGDVTDDAFVGAAIDRIIRSAGRLDVVHANAAITWTEPVSSTTVEQWRRVIDVNLTGAFILARSGFAAMRERPPGGVIIFTGSPHAMRTIPEASAYSAAKGGISSLMKALALEAAPYGVRVNSVLPGAVDTPALRSDAALSGNPPEMIRRWGEVRPLGRIAVPSEIAACVLFLASEASSYMTGAELLADGGIMAAMPKDLGTTSGPPVEPLEADQSTARAAGRSGQ